jgi:hypothetical protein
MSAAVAKKWKPEELSFVRLGGMHKSNMPGSGSTLWLTQSLIFKSRWSFCFVEKLVRQHLALFWLPSISQVAVSVRRLPEMFHAQSGD